MTASVVITDGYYRPVRATTKEQATSNEPDEPDDNLLARHGNRRVCGKRVYMWSLCVSLLVVVALAFAALFLWALFRDRTPAPSCRLAYTDNNVITEEMMQTKAREVGWPVEHPSASCSCSAGRFPVWIAPGDLCELFNVIEWEHCSLANADHVKVCLSQEQVDQLWNVGMCHDRVAVFNNSMDGGNGDGRSSGGSTRVHLGYDGYLFCNEQPTKIGAECTSHEFWRMQVKCDSDKTILMCQAVNVIAGDGQPRYAWIFPASKYAKEVNELVYCNVNRTAVYA
jgi:hypothetical protein